MRMSWRCKWGWHCWLDWTETKLVPYPAMSRACWLCEKLVVVRVGPRPPRIPKDLRDLTGTWPDPQE